MRTCPACGEDTKAETTEPCTECGFSPISPDDGASWDQSGWAAAPEEPVPPQVAAEPPPLAPPPPPPTPSEPQPEYGFPDQPAPAPQPSQSRGKVGLVWILLIIAGLAWQGFNLFDGCGEIFDEATGPTAEETESALTSDAELQGLTGATVECPDSAEDTEVGGTFECTITTAAGNSDTVTVKNKEEEFEWSREPFIRLLQQEAGSG